MRWMMSFSREQITPGSSDFEPFPPIVSVLYTAFCADDPIQIGNVPPSRIMAAGRDMSMLPPSETITFLFRTI